MALRISNLVAYDDIISGHSWTTGSNSSTSSLTKLNSDSQREQLLINFWAKPSTALRTPYYTTYRTLFETLNSFYDISSNALIDERVTGSPSSYLLRPGIRVEIHRDRTTGKLAYRFWWRSQYMTALSGGSSYLYNRTRTIQWEEDTAYSWDETEYHNFHLIFDAKNNSYSFKINGKTATELGFTETDAGGTNDIDTFSNTQNLTTEQLGAIAGVKWVNPLYLTNSDNIVITRPWIGWASTVAGMPPASSFVVTSPVLDYPKTTISLNGTESTTSIRALSWHQRVESNQASSIINRGSAGTYWNYAWQSGPGPEYYGDEPGPGVLHEGVFNKFVEDDYVSSGYVSDGTIAGIISTTVTAMKYVGGIVDCSATATLSTTAGLLTDINLTLFGAATVTTSAGVYLGLIETLSAEATIAATGSIAYTGAAALSAEATLTSVGSYQLPGTAALSASATLTAVGNQTHDASSALSAEFSITARPDELIFAEAVLSSEFTTYNNGGKIIEPNEDYPYTWDELDQWTEWPSAEWEPKGVVCVAFNTVLAVPGYVVDASADLTATASLSAAGTNVVFISADLSSTATLTASAGIYKDAIANLASESTLTALGLRIQEIYMSAFSDAAVTTNATVKYGATATLESVSTVTTNAGVKFATSQAALSSTAALTTDLNYIFNANAQLSSAFTIASSITVSTRDSYRTYRVAPETRVINVLAEPRTIVVPEQSRIITVPVPPIIAGSLERQI
jgi:hypothetical protein